MLLFLFFYFVDGFHYWEKSNKNRKHKNQTENISILGFQYLFFFSVFIPCSVETLKNFSVVVSIFISLFLFHFWLENPKEFQTHTHTHN